MGTVLDSTMGSYGRRLISRRNSESCEGGVVNF